MEHQKLTEFFSTQPTDSETEEAYLQIREDSKTLAETLNKLLAETPTKADLIGRLFRIMVDAELAIRMEGLSKTKPMIVRN
jgi:hypothetical protein